MESFFLPNMNIPATIPRDGNGIAIPDPDWALAVEKTVTFADVAGQGATGTVALFTVTGMILGRLIAQCTTELAGATATLAVGATGNTAGIIAQTTATDIDAGEIWRGTTPDIGIVESVNIKEWVLSQSIFATVATAAITSGVIKFVLCYYPLTQNANVVAA